MKSIFALKILILTSFWTHAQHNSFDFKYNENGIDKIDTFKETFVRSYIRGDTVIQFELTPGDRKTIYRYANDLGIIKIKPPIRTRDCEAVSFPAYLYELEFLNSKREIVSIIWGNNDCDDKTIAKLQTFTSRVVQLILSKKEFRNLKDTDIRNI